MKTSRNDPCPCGSGRKYKHCCLQKDEAAASAARASAQQEVQAQDEALLDAMSRHTEQMDALISASNAVLAQIRAGALDEAEAAARDLLVRFPEAYDGYDRLGQVHEARGELQKAADCYRQVVAFMRARADEYPRREMAIFERLIEKLDPSTSG
jgi:hypothetical protein